MRRIISLVLTFAVLAQATIPQTLALTELSKQALSRQDTLLKRVVLPESDGIIVMYRSSLTKASTDRANNRLESLGLEVAESRGGIALISPESGISDEEALAIAKRDPAVMRVQKNYLYEPLELITEPRFSELWHLTNSGQVINGQTGTTDADIDWSESRDITLSRTGSEVIVAIIDSGVAYRHPDLSARMWNGENCLSDTGSPLGACIHGYDFASVDNDPLPESSDHGTHVAGIVAASLNGTGVIGVAPSATLMAIRAGNESFSTFALVRSIDFARHNGAKVLNLSLGGAFSPDDILMYEALARYDLSGGLTIAAAGNSSLDHDLGGVFSHYPSDFGVTTSHSGVTFTGLTSVISVAATNNQDALASFSDFGRNTVHLGAPGVSILSNSVNLGTLMTLEVTDFTTRDDGDLSGLTLSGETEPQWDILSGAVFGLSVLFADTRGFIDDNVPYLSGAHTWIEKTLDFSSVSGGRRTFAVDTLCDTPDPFLLSSLNKDYGFLGYMSGGTFVETNRFNEFPLSDFGFDQNGHEVWAGTVKMTLPESAGPTPTVRIGWKTDILDDLELSTSGALKTHWGCGILGYATSVTDDGSSGLLIRQSGTSMATPVVAGIAAQIWSYAPTLSASEVKNLILSSGDPLPALATTTISGKRANLYNALATLASPEVRNLSASGAISVSWALYRPGGETLITWNEPIGGGNISSYFVSATLDGNEVFSGSAITANSTLNILTGGTVTVNVRAINDRGGSGSVSTAFEVDTLPPTPSIPLSPLDGETLSGSVITLAWSPATDLGSTVESYELMLSGSLSQTITLSSTSTGITLPEGIYTWSVRARDRVGLLSVASPVQTFTVDTTGPTISLMTISDDNIIVRGEESAASGQIITSASESGAIVTLTATDAALNTLTFFQSVNALGVADFSGMNLSSLTDGTVTVSASITDSVGNTGPTRTVFVTKSTFALRSAIITEGPLVNTTSVHLLLTSEDDVEYEIMSPDILTSVTGSLVGGISQSVPLTLTPLDGVKSLSVVMTPVGSGSLQNLIAGTTLDTTPPLLSITSHASGMVFTGTLLRIGGTSSDLNGVASITVDGLTASGIATWERIVNVSTVGPAIYTVSATDQAGNATTTTTTLTRAAIVSVPVVTVSDSLLTIEFISDVTWTGVLEVTVDGITTVLTGTTTDTQHTFSIVAPSASSVISFRSLLSIAGAISGQSAPTPFAFDTLPDSVSFTSITDAEVGATLSSSVVRITGINTSAPVSVSAGMISIDGGAPASSGSVSSGSTLSLIATSAATHDTDTLITAQVGARSATWSIRTRSAPIVIAQSVSSGGGGGGQSSVRVDTCPSGDLSPSYYDRTCEWSSAATLATTSSAQKSSSTPTTTKSENDEGDLLALISDEDAVSAWSSRTNSITEVNALTDWCGRYETMRSALKWLTPKEGVAKAFMDKCLIHGYGNGDLALDRFTTRGEFLKIAMRAAGMSYVTNGMYLEAGKFYPSSQGNPGPSRFADVETSDAFYGIAEAAYVNSILYGISEESSQGNITLSLSTPITRDEAALFLARILEREDMNVREIDEDSAQDLLDEWDVEMPSQSYFERIRIGGSAPIRRGDALQFIFDALEARG